MTRPPTISDVAAAAGVSTGTVSLALNNKGRVSAETREKVRKVAADLGYRPSVRARRLRGGRSNTVALVTTVPEEIVGGESSLSFLLGLSLPLSRVLLERGYSMLLLPPRPDERQLDAVDVDGVVLVDPRRGDPLCRSLRERGIEVVSIGRVDGITVGGAVDRGWSGADVAVGRLVERGARTIAVITGDGGNSVSENVRQFCREAPVPEGVDLIHRDVSASAGERGGYDVIRALLATAPGLDAVYAPVDVVALGVLRGIRDAGRSVPGDLAVITNFDGPRAAGAHPRLTALDLDLPGIAEAAGELLVECLAEPSDEVRVMASPAPTVVERESTAR
ncbi:LacI family DNA-binding transcriptional regulator [uncultured Corynebacterium sp.]|uniref:LacI family DNA-binding transcriptional regulator n=1 Tax=uncultured Corynebacterium sp. TaxID=159447 RepID=UPI0025E35241|nr:LacI family DNA-binding transcriptional regulator [uncultured Corynebacterium sp.]